MVLWLGREHVCNGLHATGGSQPDTEAQQMGEPSLWNVLSEYVGHAWRQREPVDACRVDGR